MHLSIIIINFNTPELSLACIESIKQFTTEIDYEIILVDNAPKENFKSKFEECHSNLKYIHSKENIGFGRANNLGMEIAKGAYFLLLNSDTLLFNNSIKQCLEFLELEQSQKIGLIGCKLLNEDGTYQASFYPFQQNTLWNYFKSNNPILFKLLKIQEAYNENNEIRKVGDVSGAFMLLRRSVYNEVKGFDPDFFLYCEETDWCRNRIVKQFDIYYYPNSAIIHLGGKSAPKKLMYFQSQLSLALFWYKKGVISYFFYFLISWLNGFCFLLILPFSNKKSKEHSLFYLKGLFKILPYLFHDIPQYKRAFNSRKESLVIKDAKKIFFGGE
jgi:GT2 family glycosyltransferase